MYETNCHMQLFLKLVLMWLAFTNERGMNIKQLKLVIDFFIFPQEQTVNPSENAFTLFYGKFRTNAPKVKALMDQIEQRLGKSPE